MKNIAIALCLLGFASSAFAAGTEIIIPAGGFQALENPVLTEAEYKQALKSGFKNMKTQTSTTEKEVKFGTQKQSTPNSYWNHGRVNFGAGSLGNGGNGMNRW